MRRKDQHNGPPAAQDLQHRLMRAGAVGKAPSVGLEDSLISLQDHVSMTDVYFGGPDYPRGSLRDRLLSAIESVPNGGWIRWATYYFRDVALARSLVEAARRGVDVICVLEARPRIANANREVIGILSGATGLGSGLRLVCYPGLPAPGGKVWKPQLHEKVYCFSDPAPHALVGSFNPSGNGIENSHDIIRAIGDQDVGDNILVRIDDPGLAAGLKKHVESMHRRPTSLRQRIGTPEPLRSADTTIHFWPRIGTHPVIELLTAASADAKIRIAASHIRSSSLVRHLHKLSRLGAHIEILADATHRRFRPAVERALIEAGVLVTRMPFAHDSVPMHFKLLLLEDGQQRTAVFGSYNWTLPSFYLNNEIAVVTTGRLIFNKLSTRWQEIAARHEPVGIDTEHARGLT